MAGVYQYITFDQAIAQVAALLDVPVSSSSYWTSTELGLYVIESLRTFAGLSRFYRARGTFNLFPTIPYYDLPTQLPAFRSYNVTDRDLVTLIQYHLLEPPTPTAWTGTEQFTLSDLADALTRRTNQFLFDTQCTMTSAGSAYPLVVNLPAPPIDRVQLPDSITAVRHVNWNDGLGNWYSLWRDDNWAIDAANNSAMKQAPNSPVKIWTIVETPQLVMRLFPPPLTSGLIELIVVQAPVAFDPSALATTLTVPDDYTWAIKWGALADLLNRDGQARDPARAKYCEMRYQEGVIACRAGSSVLDVQFQGAPFWMTSYTQMVAQNQTWRANVKRPVTGGMLGQNLITFAPVPDQAYAVSMDVVRNAVLPTAGSDFIQLGREELDVVLNYARHIACFKMAGEEFTNTMDAWQRMVKLGMQYNNALKANAKDLAAMKDLSLLDREFMPDQEPTPERQLVNA